jgi:hypothetical protein
MTVINLEHEVELRHLQHFVAVAEEHSFTRAAARNRFGHETDCAKPKQAGEHIGHVEPPGSALTPGPR